MKFHDPIYGPRELKDYIIKILQTDEMMRLRRVPQSVCPNYLTQHGSMTSRFHHGLNVGHLADIVIKNNPCLGEYAIILPVSGTLHDAGNSAFSHLAEPFLEAVVGCNGESFLSHMLFRDSPSKNSLAVCLDKLGIDPQQILNFVTGMKKPISNILHGSLDIDNLDNVIRYCTAVGIKVSYSPLKIAAGFRFVNNEWTLPLRLKRQVEAWQKARKDMYGFIYGDPNLNVAAMLQRALEIAYSANMLSEEFFMMHDDDALHYLKVAGHRGVSTIVDRLYRWDWYKEVYSEEIRRPSGNLLALAKDINKKKEMADWLGRYLKIEQDCIAVQIIEMNDRRKISIPFIDAKGHRTFDESDDELRVLIKAYVHESVAHRRNPYGNCINHYIQQRP